MPPRKRPSAEAGLDLDGPAPHLGAIQPAAPCPACGSRACALTGYPFCRHTGAPRDPDPTAHARLVATGLPGPLIPTSQEAA